MPLDSMPLVLAADTSTPVCSVALCRGGRVLAEAVEREDRRAAERLLSLADGVLREAGAALRDLDLLAVSAGPGSFTGLRIGAAAWKGLAFALRKPLVGVPTLEALARAAGVPEGTVCTLIDARMRECYGAVFEFRAGVRTRRAPDRAAPVEACIAGLEGAVLCIGDGALLYAEALRAALPEARIAPAARAYPPASAVAFEAAARHAAGDPGDAAALAPVYLRASQAEINAARAAGAAS